MKSRIAEIAAKVKELKFIFCLMLAECLSKYSDNLSKTLPATYVSSKSKAVQ